MRRAKRSGSSWHYLASSLLQSTFGSCSLKPGPLPPYSSQNLRSSYTIGPTGWQPAYAFMASLAPADAQCKTRHARLLWDCLCKRVGSILSGPDTRIAQALQYPAGTTRLLGAQTGVMLSAVCFCIIPNYLEPAACDDLSNTGCEKLKNTEVPNNVTSTMLASYINCR